MNMKFEIGHFDVDIVLRDEAVNPQNTPTQRMLANACIGMDAEDAYHSTCELKQAVNWVNEQNSRGRGKLIDILSNDCDDFQRCLYFCLAGRGIFQMAEDLHWLSELLHARGMTYYRLKKQGKKLMSMKNPYVAQEPDGPLIAKDYDFVQGASWYLDPDLMGDFENE